MEGYEGEHKIFDLNFNIWNSSKSLEGELYIGVIEPRNE